MSDISSDPAATRYFFFHGKHTSVAGKNCVHYRCFGPGAEVLFSAHAFRSFRPTPIFFSGPDRDPDYLLRMRKTFALTGKIDLLEAGTESLRGVVTRGRKFYDAQQRLVGRFDHAASWKEMLGESLIDAAGELIFGNGDGAQTTDGSDRFVLSAEGRATGSLMRKQLPFFPDPPRRTGPNSVGRVMKKILPGKLGSALFDITPPVGWCLELSDESAFPDQHLLLGATLMTIEMRRW